MERPIPRRRAPFVKGDTGTVSRLAAGCSGARTLRPRGARSRAERQLRHVPRRLHAERPGLVQRASTTRPTASTTGTASDDNLSWNCGVEGPTDDPAVEALRNRQVKNFLTMLLLAAGTPMLLMGDEVRRTQRGNNNAYCQDNETQLVRLAAARAPRRHPSLRQGAGGVPPAP